MIKVDLEYLELKKDLIRLEKSKKCLLTVLNEKMVSRKRPYEENH